MKLLILEDEPELRELLSEQLSNEFEVFTAANGREGLALLAKTRVAGILTDLNMPIMNGLEFMKALRMRGDQTPVVVLTACGEHENTLDALRLGALDFVEKPLSRSRLRKIAHAVVRCGQDLERAELELAKLSSMVPHSCLESCEQIKRVLSRLRFDAESYALVYGPESETRDP